MEKFFHSKNATELGYLSLGVMINAFIQKPAKGGARVCQKYVGETGYEPPHGIVACF